MVNLSDGLGICIRKTFLLYEWDKLVPKSKTKALMSYSASIYPNVRQWARLVQIKSYLDEVTRKEFMSLLISNMGWPDSGLRVNDTAKHFICVLDILTPALFQLSVCLWGLELYYNIIYSKLHILDWNSVWSNNVSIKFVSS